MTPTDQATLAIVMARGLGTRMRRTVPAPSLTPEQEAMAALGLKGMIPDSRGRPLLDHIFSSLADGGVTEVVLVVAPDHGPMRHHYDATPPERIRLHWAVQPEPTGTADAVLAAAPVVGERPFLVCNADNLYPVAAIASLVTLGTPGVVAFDREALIRESNIDAARIATFATLTIDDKDQLTGIVEKPGAGSPLTDWIGMNLWRFDQRIFAACRRVPRSERGERELPQAVALALHDNMPVRAVRLTAGVLDLSARDDIAVVADTLGRQTPRP